MKANNKPANGRRKVQKAREIGSQKGDENSGISKAQTGSDTPGEREDSANVETSKNNFYKELKSKKKDPLIVFLGSLLVIVIVLFFSLSVWFYQIILEHESKLNGLTQRLEDMPAPISEGRLGLIIKKSNKKLESRINADLISIEGKILEIKQELGRFPQPMSEGKVGLMLDRGIKQFRKDMEEKVNGVLSSFQQLDQTQAQKNDLDPEIRRKLKELELSVETLTGTIGLEILSKSISEEILDLKRLVKTRKKTSFTSETTSGKLSSDISPKDFTLIAKRFSEYAYNAIKQDMTSKKKDGFFNSIVNKFQLVFVQRSLTPQDGNSVDAILSRAEAALNVRDYEKVLDELNQLPQGALEVMMEWKKSFDSFLEEKR
jgi:hypothetical protein